MSSPFSTFLTGGLNPSQGGSSESQESTSAPEEPTSASTPSTTSIPDSTPTSSSPSTTSTTSSTSDTSTSTSTDTSTSPTSTSTTSTSSSSSSSSSSTSSSTSTSSSATSFSTSSTSSTLPNPSTPTAQTSLQVSIDSNGETATITVINSIAPSDSAIVATNSASDSNGSSNSFFDNRGAVAGTFTVVGLIGVALLIFLLTWFIRRRKIRRADRESEEAAAEAANASVPVFLDEYDDRPRYGEFGYDAGGGYAAYGNGSGFDAGGGGVYSKPLPSASSHGTFAQPPMSTESYQMADMNGAPFADDATYPAFVTHRGSQQQYGYSDNGHPGPSDSGSRPLSGAFSIGESPETQMTEYNTTAPVSRANTTLTTPTESQSDLSRAKSQGSRSLLDGYYSSTTPSSPTNTTHNFISPPSGESYAAHYQPGFSGVSASKRRSSVYDILPITTLSNPFTRSAEDDDDGSESGGEEVEAPRRVLKVANE